MPQTFAYIGGAFFRQKSQFILMFFIRHLRLLRFTYKLDLTAYVKTYARQACFNRLILRRLWDSQTLFKVKSAPPWRAAGTERLSTIGNRRVNNKQQKCAFFKNLTEYCSFFGKNHRFGPRQM